MHPARHTRRPAQKPGVEKAEEAQVASVAGSTCARRKATQSSQRRGGFERMRRSTERLTERWASRPYATPCTALLGGTAACLQKRNVLGYLRPSMKVVKLSVLWHTFTGLLATCKWTPASSWLEIAECLAPGTQSTQHGFLIASAECFFSERRRPSGLLQKQTPFTVQTSGFLEVHFPVHSKPRSSLAKLGDHTLHV